MSATENKARLRRGMELSMNEQQLDAVDEVLSPDYVNHGLPAPEPGPEGFKQLIRMFHAAFPDLYINLEDMVAEGNLVASRGRMTGTHRGDFMGIPATGKPVDVGYMDLWRFDAAGKAIENWVQLDQLGLMQQLGVVPGPA